MPVTVSPPSSRRSISVRTNGRSSRLSHRVWSTETLMSSDRLWYSGWSLVFAEVSADLPNSCRSASVLWAVVVAAVPPASAVVVVVVVVVVPAVAGSIASSMASPVLVAFFLPLLPLLPLPPLPPAFAPFCFPFCLPYFFSACAVSSTPSPSSPSPSSWSSSTVLNEYPSLTSHSHTNDGHVRKSR